MPSLSISLLPFQYFATSTPSLFRSLPFHSCTTSATHTPISLFSASIFFHTTQQPRTSLYEPLVLLGPIVWAGLRARLEKLASIFEVPKSMSWHVLLVFFKSNPVAASFWDIRFFKPIMEFEMDYTRAQIIELKAAEEEEVDSEHESNPQPNYPSMLWLEEYEGLVAGAGQIIPGANGAEEGPAGRSRLGVGNACQGYIFEDHLATYVKDYPAKFILGYCSTYIFMQTFMIPGTIFMSLLAGVVFGVMRGLLLVVFNARARASSCFFLSKLIGRPLVSWLWPEKLSLFQAKIAKRRENLLNYMPSLKITPTLPNFFINLASPIADIPLHVFFLPTFIGLIPAPYITVQVSSLY